jgi:DNA mismatch repair protein MutS
MSKTKKNPMAALVASIRSADAPSIRSTDASSANQNIYDKYLEYTRQYKEQYGSRTIVLMMVGSFFEVYGLKDADTVTGSDILEFAKICQMNISEKKKVSVGGKTVLMAGFPEYTLDRYLNILSDAGYTSVVFVQDEENSVQGDKKKHRLHSIHSAGTYMPYETEQPKLSNNIMCVWLKTFNSVYKKRPQIVYGIAVINIFTGKSSIFEHTTTFENAPSTFDELERNVSIYAPCEVIFLYDFESFLLGTTGPKTLPLDKGLRPASSIAASIKSFCGLQCDSIHDVYVGESVKAANCQRQQYVVQILETFFGSDSYTICDDFSRYQIATQALCYLLNFVQEHNPNLVKKIALPAFSNTGTNAVLANHTLKQLNIIEDHSADSIRSGRLSSVLNFLNRATTSIGKRRIKEILTCPVFDADWLNAEYAITAHMLEPDNYHYMELFKSQLSRVMDLERAMRQIMVRRIAPATIWRIHESAVIIQQVHICLAEQPRLLEYLAHSAEIEACCRIVTDNIGRVLDLDLCKNINGASFSEHIVRPGINAELDAMMAEYRTATETLDAIHRFFNMIMQSSATGQDGTDYVKINTTEKSGSSIQITKTRGKLLKQLLDRGDYKVAPCFRGIMTVTAPGHVVFSGTEIKFADIKFKAATTANDEIAFDQLTRITGQILRLENAIQEKTAVLYAEFVVNTLEPICCEPLEKMAEYVMMADVLQCRAVVARENRYCRPVIQESSVGGSSVVGSSVDRSSVVSSFIKASGLRHVLIEHIQKNETYVPNDVELCGNGILLYGTNAVGKTSLIRAVGIATIMAQCGFFVPCSQFVYNPYRSFYTRILGNDNLYKGLSTFGVEMSELQVILKNADTGSMILGDELCSGTETQSALSIFVAGLMDLHGKGSSFIFATHFHEIVKYDEIEALDRLSLKHMAVHYDREQDCLVYDRVMRDGPGDNMYGLEVCKSLHLPMAFLDQAFAIRNKYFPEQEGTLGMKVSRYNAQKIRGMCERCGTELSTETHHLEEQANADSDGFIVGTAVHKNHAANLMALCEKCHLEIHKAAKKVVKKKTTKGYIAVVEP